MYNQRENDTLLSIMDEIKDYGIILLDIDGNVQNWNKGAQQIKGYAETEIIGENFKIFYTMEDRELGKPEKLLGSAILDGRAFDEGWRQKKDGSNFWGSITITPIYDNDQKIIGFVKITRDLTEAKKAEQSRWLETRNKELEHFSYVASHDLQEPLRTISNYIQVIKEDHASGLNEEVLQYLNTIDNAATRMSNLIKALLYHARLGKKSAIVLSDCNLLIKDVVSDLEKLITSNNAIIEISELPTINIHPVELRQLFQNLITNAIKFKNKNTDPRIKISCSKHDSGYCFIVEDNGIGIEEKNYDLIFNIFQQIESQHKLEGYGIGLANCKKIAAMHQGDIWVVSKLYAGSIFYITISNHLV